MILNFTPKILASSNKILRSRIPIGWENTADIAPVAEDEVVRLDYGQSGARRRAAASASALRKSIESGR
jgi:hypothetical protein